MVEYSLKRIARSRSIRIRVLPSGQVQVTSPRLMPKLMIDQFVKKSEPWIEQQLRKNKLKRQASPVLDWEQQLLSYLGNLYTFRFVETRRGVSLPREKITIHKQLITVNPVTGDEKHLKQTLLKWLQGEADAYFRQQVPMYAESMGISYKKLTFRQQRSRWGSCSSNGTLSFNWRLIHFKPAVIDYVIIHELAHVKHMDHSAHFWALVRQHDPGYRDKVRFLKHQVLEIERI